MLVLGEGGRPGRLSEGPSPEPLPLEGTSPVRTQCCHGDRGKDGHALTWTDLRAGQKRTASVRVLHFLNPVCPLTLSLGQHSLGVRDSFKSEGPPSTRCHLSRSGCGDEASLHLQSVDHTHPASRWEDENSICKRRHGKSTLTRERH